MLNRTMTYTIMVSSIAVMAMATSAMAQGWGPWFGPGRGMGPGMMGGRMAIIDQNDDGRISDEEAASAAEEVFVSMDSDDDGELTKEEYLAVRMGFGPGWNSERQAAMQANKEARFSEMDTDKSGSVSRTEFLGEAKAHHAAADTDGDGVVSPWEHRHRARF